MPLPNAGRTALFFDRRRRLWQWRARHRGDKALHTRHPNLRKGVIVAKPEWGTKRICPSCGTRYYDLMRDPVVCPKCSTPFDPEAFLPLFTDRWSARF